MLDSVVMRVIGSVGAVSAVPLLVTTFLPRNPDTLRRVVRWLVAFAAGALLGSAFLHLIPEAFATPDRERVASILLLLGFFAFFVFERFLWRHHRTSDRTHKGVRPVAALNLIGDAAHNLVDGIAIAAAYLSDTHLGMGVTLAVLLHEVPQEIGDYGILLNSGISRSRAIAWNFASGCVAILGAVAVLALGTRVAGLAETIVPLTAGGFLYIAASDLLPNLREREGPRDTLWLLLTLGLGVALVSLPLALNP